jgi:hypothetical protein
VQAVRGDGDVGAGIVKKKTACRQVPPQATAAGRSIVRLMDSLVQTFVFSE